jgi:hypothetical protein
MDDVNAIERSDPAYRGQAVYTARTLRAYDAIVVKLSNSLVWRCPARTILAQYDRHISDAHLDVGPGTGYYLDRGRAPGDITLLDPNPDVLRYAARRLARYAPATKAADVLKPIDLEPGSFRSASLSYVLHCLPGDIDSKAVAFDHLIPLVEPGGVVFGTTILGRGVEHNRLARVLMRAYNRKGIFSNLDDDRERLERCLADRFDRFELEVSGSVALFAGWPA